ncbi:MAG: hypothetical protein F9K23_10660 [Bacteroidetes bacterium]|nr:MAG: hypothetical protein F9K23_10660 [Bacteroidota bacterium]
MCKSFTISLTLLLSILCGCCTPEPYIRSIKVLNDGDNSNHVDTCIIGQKYNLEYVIGNKKTSRGNALVSYYINGEKESSGNEVIKPKGKDDTITNMSFDLSSFPVGKLRIKVEVKHKNKISNKEIIVFLKEKETIISPDIDSTPKTVEVPKLIEGPDPSGRSTISLINIELRSQKNSYLIKNDPVQFVFRLQASRDYDSIDKNLALTISQIDSSIIITKSNYFIGHLAPTELFKDSTLFFIPSSYQNDTIWFDFNLSSDNEITNNSTLKRNQALRKHFLLGTRIVNLSIYE